MYQKGMHDSTICKTLNDKGVECFLTNRYMDALRMFIMATELSERFKNTKVYISCCIHIGIIYAIFKDYQRAIFYFKKSYLIASEHNDFDYMGRNALNLAISYCRIGDVGNAWKYFAIQTKYPNKDKHIASYFYIHNKGIILFTSRQYRKSISLQEEALKLAYKYQLPVVFLSDAYLELGKCYEKLGMRDSALSNYKLTVNTSQESAYYNNLCEAYKNVADIYKSMHVADSSSFYQSKYIELSDSIFNEQEFNKAKNELFKYEDMINSNNIHLLNYKISTQYLIIILISILSISLLVILIIVIIFNRKLHSAQHLLVSKNQEIIKQNEYLKSIQTNSKNDKVIDNKELDSKKILALQNEIKAVMEDTDIIFNPNFSINELAFRIKSNTQYVSFVINETFHKNFKTLLNEYRIREASKRLVDTEHYGNYTVVAIGESVGYNSQTSFFQAFKKIVGVTPAIYKKMIGKINK